ncbi:MAG: Na/Pi cotransporter family protein [Kiritimatiellia bacterium]|nr:Na/Pi cotransporter family protein [Kiritimatiellia bacterium]
MTVSITSILIQAAGGLGIFLLGMQHLSEGLQAVAGQRMRKLVAAATSNRFAGVVTGIVVTGLVQSSSVVTVMVVGLATAGIMTLVQAINVIIGANIGTTATAWIVAMLPSIGDSFFMILLVIGAVPYLFAKKERWRYSGLVTLAVGLIFLGLQVMSNSLKPISANPEFVKWFQIFSADSYIGLAKCILTGTILTAIIQSSAAATAISITLAMNGVISFETGASLVFGMNIGTTVTAWLAALGGTIPARRAALAHTLFNFIGVLIFAPFFLDFIVPFFRYYYPEMYECRIENGVKVFPYITAPIAMVHTCFNLANTCLFIPFVHAFARLIERLVPGEAVSQRPRLEVLDIRNVAPVVAVEQARKEVEYMAHCDKRILDEFRAIFTSNEADEEQERHIFETEDKLDRIQHEVSIFLGKVMTMPMPSDAALRAKMILRVADEYESVSDEIAALLKVTKRMRNSHQQLTEAGRKEMLALHDHCAAFAAMVTEAFRYGKRFAPDILANMHADSQSITKEVKTIRSAQLDRLENHVQGVESLKIVDLMDMLSIYRRLKETYLNIGEAILEENSPRYADISS